MRDLKCPFCFTALAEHPADTCLDVWVAVSRGDEVPPFRDELYYGIHSHPAYSTDWAEAGKLLEEMGAGTRCTLQTPVDGSWRWRMALWTFDRLGDLHLCKFLGDSGPHAIALGYIAWKGSYGQQAGDAPNKSG